LKASQIKLAISTLLKIKQPAFIWVPLANEKFTGDKISVRISHIISALEINE